MFPPLSRNLEQATTVTVLTITGFNVATKENFVAHQNGCFSLDIDLPGTVCSIATINAREKDGQGPWKIAVAYRSSDSKLLATKLLEFEVTMDILNGEYS